MSSEKSLFEGNPNKKIVSVTKEGGKTYNNIMFKIINRGGRRRTCIRSKWWRGRRWGIKITRQRKQYNRGWRNQNTT